MLDSQAVDFIYYGLKTDSNEDLLSKCRDIEAHVGEMDPKQVGFIADALMGLLSLDTEADPALIDIFPEVVSAFDRESPELRDRAVQEIGRPAKADYLSDDQKAKASTTLASILAIGGTHEWDRAFIVRREAEDAYKYLTGVPARPKSASELCSE